MEARRPGAREEPQPPDATVGWRKEGQGAEGQGAGGQGLGDQRLQDREEHPGAPGLEEGSWAAAAGCPGTRLWLQTGLGVGAGGLNLSLRRQISSLILWSLPSPCL